MNSLQIVSNAALQAVAVAVGWLRIFLGLDGQKANRYVLVDLYDQKGDHQKDHKKKINPDWYRGTPPNKIR